MPRRQIPPVVPREFAPRSFAAILTVSTALNVSSMPADYQLRPPLVSDRQPPQPFALL